MSDWRYTAVPTTLCVAGNNCYSTHVEGLGSRFSVFDSLMLQQFLSRWPGEISLLCSETDSERRRSALLPFNVHQIGLRGWFSTGIGRVLTLPITAFQMARIAFHSDVIYARLPSPNGFWLALVALTLRKPYFISLHGAPKKDGWPRRLIVEWARRRVISRAKIIFTTSIDLILLYGRPSGRVVAYRSTTLSAATLSAPQENALVRCNGSPLNLGYVGRLSAEKNPELFVEVVAELAKRGLDVCGHIVGSGPLEKRVRERAENSNSGGARFKLYGWVDNAETVLEILSGFDVLLLTSFGEGSPKVILEGMAKGTPTVVGYVNDSLKEFLLQGLVVGVDGFNPILWADAIEQFTQSDIYESTVTKGYSAVKKHTLENLALQIESELVQGGILRKAGLTDE